MTFASRGAFDPDGPVARSIADLWWFMLALGTIVFVVFAAVLIAALRRRDPAGEEPSGDRPNRMIVLGGVVMPTIVLVFVMGLTVAVMADLPDRGPPDALQVEVIGHQWWYEIRYPDHDVVTANEVHLPAGRPVEFRLSSADVIHSFWIPELGGKLDMLPEDVNTLVLEADAPGTYRSQCAEFCGLQHAKMGFVAVVQTPEEFQGWLSRTRAVAAAPASGSAAQGRSAFASLGCGTCHTVRGTPASGTKGPDLSHLASRRTIGAATLPNTRDALARWITDPHQIKRGVKMPGVDLDDEQLRALLDYLGSLR